MATQKLQKKKKNAFIRDVYKLYRSISKLWPRDKHKIASPSAKDDHNSKTKLKSKSKSKSKSKDDVKRNAVNDPPFFNFQEARDDETQKGWVNLCKVRSYRYDGSDFLQNKSSLSRSCSQKMGIQKKSLSTLKRSRSSNKVDAYGFTPSLKRTTSTTNTTILYSSSSAGVAKAPPTKQILECTLEELCIGCTKMIEIKRDVITSTGEASQEEEKVKIKVKPGWRGGTKVTFEGKGNERLGRSPADLTFVIVEKEHELFRRDGDDLVMAMEIPLVEALTGCNLSVPLPDGDNINLKIDNVIHTESLRVIQGKGMPHPKEKGKRGDLKIIFRIKFPKELTEDQRAEIRSILEDST